MPSNMHSDKRPTYGSLTLKTLTAAVASALLFSNAYAAGLGKLTVLSPLGQPLRAEIELTAVSMDDAGALNAKLASAEAFSQANIDFNPALSSLRFNIEQRGTRHFIRVTSTQPLNEPFVDMLLELSSPNGRLIREYTFLLDPADLRTTQQAQVAPAPVPVASKPLTAAPSGETATPSRPATAAASPQGAPTGVQRAAPAQRSAAATEGQRTSEYEVHSGDTLAKIARQVKTSGVSLDQMLVALFQANPDAFMGENMNRLRSGEILKVPGAETARGMSNAEARSMVVAQAADFNEYRNRLAGKVAAEAAQKSADAKQSAGGKITAQVEERPTPASESKDKLKLSNTLPAPGKNAEKGASGTLEDKIAAEKAIAEANARVKELEKNVSDLQKLLEIKNKSLAEQQKQADAAKPAAAPPAVAAAPAEPAPAAAKPAAPAAPVEPAVKPKAKPVAPPPPPEPSLVDELLNNPLILPGLGALLAALGGLGVYRMRRRKQNKPFEDSLITDSSLKANSLFGSTGGQSVDTNNSVFNSSFSPSASQLDSNEVDPVAEADVYIAYGRDAQAEEILKEALRTQPERHAVRVKLLEIYSNRKDLRAFEVLATELYGLTRGEGDEWAQAAALGVAIDPNNPLYATGKATDGGDGSPSAMVAPTQPLDEHGLATLLSATQSDTSSLESEDSLEADTSYFGNTALATEKPLEPVDETPSDVEPEPEETSPAASTNELDFDLDGLNLPEAAVPNTIPRPMPAEPPAELASIDFDFLDEPLPAVSEPAPDPLPEPSAEMEMAPEVEPVEPVPEPQQTDMPEIQDLEFSLKDDAPVAEQPLIDALPDDIDAPVEATALLAIDIPDIDIPELGGTDAPMAAESDTAAKIDAAATDPLDFDLSDISLELKPEDAGAAPDLDFEQVDMSSSTLDASSDNAEMATKLDLAIAYQEIGDKEGARELLDEVLKGGSPEQSERAKSLLLELA